MIRLSAFADEISANLDEQIAVLHKENIHSASREREGHLRRYDRSLCRSASGDRRSSPASRLRSGKLLQCAQIPCPDAYDFLYPWFVYIHVKDVRTDGILTPAGEGEGRWPDLLRRLHADGYDGFLALEPHLSAAGQFQGFSGPRSVP